MDESQVNYQGRVVQKHGFRAFVYAKENKRKLVESWDEFINHVSTGDWFSSPEELQATEELMEFAELVNNAPNDEVIMEEVHNRNRKKASK